MIKTVTERDFRMPEFMDADPADYEFRSGDGKIVRKDRWESGMRKIASAVGMGGRKEWEIDDIIEKVRSISEAEAHWIPFGKFDFKDVRVGRKVDLRLSCGSLLVGAEVQPTQKLAWNGVLVPDTVVSVKLN